MAMTSNVFKPELWSKLLLRDIMDYGVMLDCVNRNYEGEIKNQGDTVHIQSVGDVTINTHDDTADMKYQDLAGTTIPLVIDQAKDFAFLVSDIDKVQANVEFMQKYTNKAKKNISLVKDAFLHSLGVAGVDAKNQMGTVAITSANVYDTLVDLFTKLADSNAIDANGKGEDGKAPFLILPPAVVAVIKKSEEATHGTTLGDETIRKGAIMRYAGFDIKQSTNVKEDGGYKILAGTTEAITYAEQITKVESLKDINRFGDFVRGLYLYGAKVVQPTCLASATFTVA
jgi:hypothetical protein